jgi:hypothetical protein
MNKTSEEIEWSILEASPNIISALKLSGIEALLSVGFGSIGISFFSANTSHSVAFGMSDSDGMIGHTIASCAFEMNGDGAGESRKT